MNQIKSCSPLVLMIEGKEHAFWPVVMNHPLPSTNPHRWLRFLMTGGEKILLDQEQVDQVNAYMREHKTEALASDNVVFTAFTLGNDQLLQCNPAKGYELVEFDNCLAAGSDRCARLLVDLQQTTIELHAAGRKKIELPHKLPSLVSYRNAMPEELEEYAKELAQHFPDHYKEGEPLDATRVKTLLYRTTTTGYMTLHGDGLGLTFSCGYDTFNVREGGVTRL